MDEYDDVVLKIAHDMADNGGVVHRLKVWPEYFDAIRNGDKTFELRYDDRSFEVGDFLLLVEFDDRRERYTGRKELRRISYKLHDCIMFGLQPGFCILGMKEILTS